MRETRVRDGRMQWYCDYCEKWHERDDFYKDAAGRLKYCHEQQAWVNNINSQTPSQMRPGEALVLRYLESKRIPAVHHTCRKDLSHKTDVVALTSVFIEVKEAKVRQYPNGGSERAEFYFRPSNKNSHIIALVLLDRLTVHWFLATHPVFFRPDGRRLMKLQYIPNPAKKRKPNMLTHKLMMEQQDCYELVFDVFHELTGWEIN